MVLRYLTGFLFLLFWIPGKIIGSSTLKKIKKGIYEEDLSCHRVTFSKVKKEKKEPVGHYALPQDQTVHLEECLTKRKLAYACMPYVKGFTLQIYMGNSRITALKMQERAASLQTTYMPRFHYRQPHYIVQLGFFTERLEAYFVYLTLVKALPSILLRPFMLKRETYVTSFQNSHKKVLP